MGKVVNIESPETAPEHQKAEAFPALRWSSVAVVSPAAYTRSGTSALDLLAVNSTVNDFRHVHRHSAGSFIGSMSAAGVTEEMMWVLTDERAPCSNGSAGTPFARTSANTRERIVTCRCTSPAYQSMVPRFRDLSVIDIAYGWPSTCLPVCTPTRASAPYVREALATKGIVDSFDALEHELYLTGTDLDSGERVVFGDKEANGPASPFPRPSNVSTALLPVYEPVEVNGRTWSTVRFPTTNVDVAVERGAEFIVVNRWCPYVNDRNVGLPTVSGSRVRRIADMGLLAIANQAFRLLLHQRLAIAVESWKERYPG